MYYPMGSRTSMISRKNTTIINFVENHAPRRVSIDFWCTISEFQNTSPSQRISPWLVV
ncbi:hypothetical protein BHE74_00021191 [Ensete ventricosum]|nr:hypothetical protein GW17_00058384 [Ensete ventricosum]RWW71099.1 hypothetical protein BHE74_00021191 [Ensete ventricosum]RZS06744.1 hypothetical protein BHM03_00037457 [Ensete ventricosum]